MDRRRRGKKRPICRNAWISASGQSQLPFTATIKRFAWKAGKTVELSIIHISTPSLDISRLIVKVTAIEPARLYRVQVEGGEAQEIAVDADGFVRLGEMTEVV